MSVDSKTAFQYQLSAALFNQGFYTEATIHAQNQLSENPNSFLLWQLLGDCYLKNGSLQSAEKAYLNVLNLEPNNLHSKSQLASIYLQIGEIYQSKAQFEDLLQVSQIWLSARYGLMKSAYDEFVASYQSGDINEAVNKFWITLKHCLFFVSGFSNSSLFLKYLGDLCLFSDKLGGVVGKFKCCACDTLPPMVVQEFSSHSNRLKLALSCFIKLCKKYPGKAEYWHDYGLCLFRYATLANDSRHAESAILAIKKSIQLRNRSSVFWCSLGTIYCSRLINDAKRAQLCLSKALALNSHNILAWNNVGLLYLSSDEYKLAHKALQNCQALSPIFSPAWVGQGLIAEVFNPEEAPDLFRHAFTLDFLPECVRGLCYFLSQAATSTSECERILPTVSSLQNISVNRSPELENILGVLGSLLNMKYLAVEFFTSASKLKNTTSMQRLVYFNLLRVLSLTSSSERVVQSLSACPLLENEKEFAIVAYSMYNAGLYEQSLVLYQKLFSEQQEPFYDQKMFALSYLLHKLNRSQDAIELLNSAGPKFDDCFVLSALKQSIFAVTNETEIKDISTKPLFNFPGELTIPLLMVSDMTSHAIKFIESRIHNCPNEISLWCLLSLLRKDETPIMCSTLHPDLLAVLCQNMIKTDVTFALKVTQSCLHVYPTNLRLWSLLISLTHIKDEMSGTSYPLTIHAMLGALKILVRPTSFLESSKISNNTFRQVEKWILLISLNFLHEHGISFDCNMLDHLPAELKSDSAVIELFNKLNLHQ